MPRILAAAASGALALALALAWARSASLGAREVDAAGEWKTFRELGADAGPGSARLVEAPVARGARVFFELCSADAMDPVRWMGVGRLAIVRLDAPETVFEHAIDERLLGAARRGAGASCVEFARVAELAIEEERMHAAIELAWERSPEALLEVPVRARIVASSRLDGSDLALVAFALVAALALVIALALRAVCPGADDARLGPARALAAVVAVFVAGAALGRVAGGGPAALAVGIALAAAEVGVAYALVRPAEGSDRTTALALARPERPAAAIAWLLAAPVVGLALFAIARLALASAPSSGEAPIEVMVSRPSGMLSFAALAVVAPIAEEVFFRGLIYATLRGRGGVAREAMAIAGSWILFALAHLPQDWGHWGGLTSVCAAGLGLTLLRAASGSTLVPCVAHLVYNGLLLSGGLLTGAAG